MSDHAQHAEATAKARGLVVATRGDTNPTLFFEKPTEVAT